MLSWVRVGGGRVWVVLMLLPAACRGAGAFGQAWLSLRARSWGDGEWLRRAGAGRRRTAALAQSRSWCRG